RRCGEDRGPGRRAHDPPARRARDAALPPGGRGRDGPTALRRAAADERRLQLARRPAPLRPRRGGALMRVRWFGLLLLAGLLAPLLLAATWAVGRAERAAADEVRLGNARVAARAASRLAAFVDTRVAVLQTLGASLTPSVLLSPDQVTQVVRNYGIGHADIR